MIEIQNLSKHFGPIVAVDDVTFDVAPGEVLGFLGPNGAGKSTTMKMVTGFLPPTSGSAKVCGVDVAVHPIQAKERFGYLPEGAPAYPDMTTRGFLEFAAEIRGFSKPERKRRIEQVIERVHLEGVLRQPIDTLSKGFKRRVGLAQAILHDPPVLIMDEPTDGLDPNQKHEVRELITEMAADKTIILSTHILEEVEAVCTRAIIINRGRVVADGTPDELRARAQNHNAVRLRLAPGGSGSWGSGDTAAVRSLLAALGGVRKVELNGTPEEADFLVYPVGDALVVGEVSGLARRSAWNVSELRVEQGRLTDVFRSVTDAEFAASAAGASR